MDVYVTTTNEVEAIFAPPQGGLRTNEVEHDKVLYFDILSVHKKQEGN